ncbi:hypothetical protein ENINCK372B1_16190 [Enterobacter intestinihominis]
MTGVVKVTTPGGMQDMRVFSLRGAHLIGMFARTPKAKEFRRWVLDVLDREVATGSVPQAFDFEAYGHNAKVAYGHMNKIIDTWHNGLYPSLKMMESPIAKELSGRIDTVHAIIFGLNNALGRMH